MLQTIQAYCDRATLEVPRDALQVLDVALRHGTAQSDNVLIFRNNVFSMDGRKTDITMGGEVYLIEYD